MSGFSIRNPYLIVVLGLIIAILGIVSVSEMPVDMFPPINLPVVAVATFYSGMPPQQIETNITYHLERQFTLASGIDHIESRSLPGVSLIKVYFLSGTDPDADAASISSLAMSDLRDMPPGTYPPIILKQDASSVPVALVPLTGAGLSQSKLKDIGQNYVRNQLASVPGASVPQPFGGTWRQIQLFADPYKLEANQLSLMDVVRAVNDANVILPAGDAQIGRYDYDLYTNSMLKGPDDIAQVPIKTVGQSPVRVGDVAVPQDAYSRQYNIVRVDGQHAVYVPVFKGGSDANTIAIVDGVRAKLKALYDVPASLRTAVVFDQARFVRTAIETLLHEGGVGLFLTCLMILLFLGSLRATVAVFFSIPLSLLATFIVLHFTGSSVNSMVLGGLALALSRLIDNSVVVLENIFRHLEGGEAPAVAAEKGGREVALPVLAGTLTTVVVFFPVTMLYGVSRFLFSALALAVVISLFASYFVAMTVVPLFCARFIHSPHQSGEHATESGAVQEAGGKLSVWERFNAAFSRGFDTLLARYDVAVGKVLAIPGKTLAVCGIVFALSLLLFPLLGLSFFPRTDAGQFVINFKAPSGTRLDDTDAEAAHVEQIIRSIVGKHDLGMIISNLGVDPGFSALYSSNSATHTGFIQVALSPDHRVSSFAYIERVQHALATQMPELQTFFSSGSLVDGVLNMGAPAPIDIRITGNDMSADNDTAHKIAAAVRRIPNVAEVYIPQDLDYPSLRIAIDRTRASELGLTEKEVVSNVITALTSNQMIAPSIWIDPKSGNNYFLTVMYRENQVQSLDDLKAIPLHGAGITRPTRLDMVADIQQFQAPTEMDHTQIRRVMDIYVRPQSEDLGRITKSIQGILKHEQPPQGVDVNLAGSVNSMNESFRSFAIGLTLSVLLLYLILVAQFRSFLDPFIILLALPPGITGVLLALVLWGTTLNVMSLMGVVMLAGIVLTNSILIVEFAHHLMKEGLAVREAIVTSCRVRLRPILMTSLATLIGLLPMALKLGEGSEAYAPLAQALIGGLAISVLLTIFLVPAGFYLAYRNRSA
ncbi:efflux RND transporter permease subunit [Silvibacterium dinghuense]|uniref:Efflux RND transporter permease subunit n=1 Tax=Silvibacterium dinghuense TaxID=1560006 RepID=A0A4Q1SDN0_9BACT|nr:efflux RND transporter permease subunit [Silvibacterium dinghuense]RXS95197.1 efflux RND transporter permease subunit [Silvibacterium dinghuense]GGH11455.1 acriflavine resistance protein B [Silvibacterium dinghuense]